MIQSFEQILYHHQFPDRAPVNVHHFLAVIADVDLGIQRQAGKNPRYLFLA